MTGGRQRPVKGFRPGKEPAQLRKQRAKQQFGELTGTQERLVEIFAERSVQESHRLIRRWLLGLLAAAVILGVAAVALAFWSGVAAIVVGALAVLMLVLWWRLHSQREALESMADAVSGRG